MIMLREDEDGRFVLSEKEYRGIRSLFGMVTSLRDNGSILEARIRKVKYGRRDYSLLLHLCEKLTRNILNTIPKKKLIQMKKDLENTVATVEVRPPNFRAKKDGYTYIQEDVLERLTQLVVDNESFVCCKSGADAKHCRIRKDIEATCAFEYPCEKEKACPFQSDFYADGNEEAEQAEE